MVSHILQVLLWFFPQSPSTMFQTLVTAFKVHQPRSLDSISVSHPRLNFDKFKFLNQSILTASKVYQPRKGCLRISQHSIVLQLMSTSWMPMLLCGFNPDLRQYAFRMTCPFRLTVIYEISPSLNLASRDIATKNVCNMLNFLSVVSSKAVT